MTMPPTVRHPRRSPDVPALLSVLVQHEVRFIVTGSVAASLHGVELKPDDLDVTPAMDVENLRRLGKVLRLSVADRQQRFVADNGSSLAQAHHEPRAWYRAICADDTPVGFAMLEIDSEKPEYYLWRFMLDARYQGLGFGRRALELLIAHVRQLPGAREFLTSVVQAEGGPQPFYESLGFVATGEYEDGEAMLSLKL
jgi:diamine N-acetyltransferase